MTIRAYDSRHSRARRFLTHAVLSRKSARLRQMPIMASLVWLFESGNVR